jgi:hypothetical protein
MNKSDFTPDYPDFTPDLPDSTPDFTPASKASGLPLFPVPART